MPKMKIALSPLHRGKTVRDDFLLFMIQMAKEKEVHCQLTSPTEAIIDGNVESLLEILNDLRDATSEIPANGASIAL